MAEKNRAKAIKASINAGNSTWTDEETETLLDIFVLFRRNQKRACKSMIVGDTHSVLYV